MVMTRCTVEFFIAPAKLAESKVEIEVKEGAKLRDVIAALRRKVPALEGSVIVTGEDRMVEGYTFNIHGHFYTYNEDKDENLQLRDGDRIALLTIPMGG
jgi:molybdopterin converting factor small subunit